MDPREDQEGMGFRRWYPARVSPRLHLNEDITARPPEKPDANKTMGGMRAQHLQSLDTFSLSEPGLKCKACTLQVIPSVFKPYAKLG